MAYRDVVDSTNSDRNYRRDADEGVPASERTIMEPVLDVTGKFISASVLQQKLKVRHAREQNDHLLRRIEMEERRVDAAKFLIEAKMGLWNEKELPSFRIMKRKWDNQSFHYGPNE